MARDSCESDCRMKQNRTDSQTGRRAGGGVSAGRDREITDRLTDDSQTQTRDVQHPKKVLSFRGIQYDRPLEKF